MYSTARRSATCSLLAVCLSACGPDPAARPDPDGRARRLVRVRRGVVRGSGRRDRTRLRALQRDDRQVLPARDGRTGRRAVRLRQRRRPRRVPRAGRSAGRRRAAAPAARGSAARRPALPQRSGDRGRRRAPAPVHRRDRRGGRRGKRLRHGRRGRRHGQRRLDRPVPDPLRAQPDAPQPGRRHLRRRHRTERHGRSRMGSSGVVLRLRPGRPARSVRRQLPRLHAGGPHAVLRPGRRTRLLRAGDEPAAARRPLPQPGGRHLRGRDRGGRDGPRVRAGPRLGNGRFRRRRLARPLRRQRSAREPVVDEPARRHLPQPRAVRGSGARRGRQRQGRHGGRRRRFRQRRRRGPLHHGAVRPGQHPVRERRRRPVPGSGAPRSASAPRACRTPASERPGSTSTTTAGSTSSR